MYVRAALDGPTIEIQQILISFSFWLIVRVCFSFCQSMYSTVFVLFIVWLLTLLFVVSNSAKELAR